MAATNDEFLRLPPEQRQALEAQLLDFDRNWDEGRLGVRAAALPADQPWRRPALVELVKIDLERRWQAGQPRRGEDYLGGVPPPGTAGAGPPDPPPAGDRVPPQLRAPAGPGGGARPLPR